MRPFLFLTVCLAACVAVVPPKAPVETPNPSTQPAPATGPNANANTVIVPPAVTDPFAVQLKAWRANSCAADGKAATATPLTISANALPDASRQRLVDGLPKGVSLAGAWVLEADNPNFGGLSGLDTKPGGLIAVSDAGAFVSIDLVEGRPNGKGTIAYMLGADGTTLSGKSEADAEGLVYEDGVALVSFERTHRIEAFDLGGCGAAAKASRVAALPYTARGSSLDANEGAEPLWIGADRTLRFGYEMTVSGEAPLGVIGSDGVAKISDEARPVRGITQLVGADGFTDKKGRARTVYLARGFTPLTGAIIELSWGDSEAERFTLKRPMPVDNFESVATERLENGALRLWILSDDNFNDIQQTLLYAFDLGG